MTGNPGPGTPGNVRMAPTNSAKNPANTLRYFMTPERPRQPEPGKLGTQTHPHADLFDRLHNLGLGLVHGGHSPAVHEPSIPG